MQRRAPLAAGVLPAVTIALSAATLAGCSRPEDTAPAVGTIEVALSRSRVALGSPVEITYRFRLAPEAPPLGPHTVFVHFLDGDDELMWTDDHDPPTPTPAWKPGATIEYTRTTFMRSYPYVGSARIAAGLYTPGTNDRVRFSNPDRGGRSYVVAEFELLPQTENIFLIYKDGWHPTEVVTDGGGERTEWQWTKKEATVAFRNPKRDVVLFLEADNPSAGPNTAEQLDVRLGEQVLGIVPLAATGPEVRKIPITAGQLGDGDMVELRLIADKTFVPALQGGSSTGDTRELGARVFHAFVQ
jgi:hypothetical protein